MVRFFSTVEPKGFLFKTVRGLTETVCRVYSEAWKIVSLKQLFCKLNEWMNK